MRLGPQALYAISWSARAALDEVEKPVTAQLVVGKVRRKRRRRTAGSVYPENTEWPDGDRLFRIGRLQRKDAVPDSEWGAVWSVMRTLANLHGDEGVRLVVWFDG